MFRTFRNVLKKGLGAPTTHPNLQIKILKFQIKSPNNLNQKLKIEDCLKTKLNRELQITVHPKSKIKNEAQCENQIKS